MLENNPPPPRPPKKFVFLEKQRIVKMTINKMSKTQHECTEIQ